MRKSKINISASRKKALLDYESGAHGYKKFNITASEVTQIDINYMVNVINKRLYNIEKKGLTDLSTEYQKIEKYAVEKEAPFYNVNLKTGAIRFKTSTKGMTARERAEFVNVLRGVMMAKTSTAKGTRATTDARYKTFLENRNMSPSDMSYQKYVDMWRLYRDKVSSDKKDKFSSSQVITMIEFGRFAELTLEEMEEALDYMAQYDYDIDSYDEWIRQHKQSNKE